MIDTTQPLEPGKNADSNLVPKKKTKKIAPELVSSALNLSFDRYRTAANEERVELNQNVEGLQHIVCEYLNDFTIIGHTILGQRVVVRYAKNAKDYDALSELMKKTMLKLFSEDIQIDQS